MMDMDAKLPSEDNFWKWMKGRKSGKQNFEYNKQHWKN